MLHKLLPVVVGLLHQELRVLGIDESEQASPVVAVSIIDADIVFFQLLV
jgi:hypothetical protein